MAKLRSCKCSSSDTRDCMAFSSYLRFNGCMFFCAFGLSLIRENWIQRYVSAGTISGSRDKLVTSEISFTTRDGRKLNDNNPLYQCIDYAMTSHSHPLSPNNISNL